MLEFRKLSMVAISLLACASAWSQSAESVPGWAKDAVAGLKQEGLLQGYPDGTLRGRRAVTRYEMAVMLYDAWHRVSAQLEGLNGASKIPASANSEDLKAEIAEVQADVAAIRKLDGDLATLKKLIVEFEPELTQLGLDYELMRRQMNELNPRVSWLEAHRLPVRVSGDLNFLMLAGDSGAGNYGFDSVGRPLGFGRGLYTGSGQNSTRDLTVLDEFALNLESVDVTKPHWKGTLVLGNTLGALGQGATLSGKPYGEGVANIYFQTLSVDWKTSHGIRGEAGRIGHVGNPYLLSKPDTTPQFENARWDSPEWTMDGAKAQIPVSDGFLTAYAGRTAALASISGPNFQTLSFGRTALPWQPGGNRPVGLLPGSERVASIYGADFDLPFGSAALSLNYEYVLSDPALASDGDNGRGYGAGLSANAGPIKLKGGYAKTDLLRGGTTFVSRKDQAAWVSAEYSKRGVAGSLTYRYVEPLFGGAGDWGRIGMWWNPTDIKGFEADLSANLAENLRLFARGGWNTGTGITVKGQTGLSTNDRLNQYVLGLEKTLGEWRATASLETVDWNLQDRTGFTGGRPVERWYGLGVRRESEHSLLSLNWLLSDNDSKGVNGFQLGTGPKARGSLLTAQATMKF